MAKYETGYRSFEEGQKDGWKKIGGVDEAFSCIKTGYYNKMHRKEQNTKNQVLLEMAKNDASFRNRVNEALKKKVG